jgi:ketosteroid isomerase-like protein
MKSERPLEPDELEVLASDVALYEALQSLDLGKMAAVWWHEDWVKFLLSGRELIVGWEEVQESWANIFRSTSFMRVTVSRPLVYVFGDAAWVACIENVTATFEGGFATAITEATYIFARRNGEWRMVHHHAAPVPGRVPSGTSRTVQ